MHWHFTAPRPLVGFDDHVISPEDAIWRASKSKRDHLGYPDHKDQGRESPVRRLIAAAVLCTAVSAANAQVELTKVPCR
jgi:hypothetical protein